MTEASWITAPGAAGSRRVVPRDHRAAGPSAAAPAIPGIPAGADPATYKLKSVDHLFGRIASFLFVAWPDLTRPGVEILSRERPVGDEMHQRLHRFDVRTRMPTARGVRAINRVAAGYDADYRATWRIVPDGYQPSAGVLPPPTPVDPTREQSFVMPEARLRFHDRHESTLRVSGTGRTFPFRGAGASRLGFGAALNVEAGTGRFDGLHGMVAANGDFDPGSPGPLALLVRLADPAGTLLARSEVPFGDPIPDPTPGTTYLTLKGENNPRDSTELILGPDGKMRGAHGRQLLRLVRLEFAVRGRGGLRSRMVLGPVVGKLTFTLSLDPTTPPPVPLRSTGSRFELFDRSGVVVGTFGADIVAGAGYPTELPGAPTPVLRGVGLSPLVRGTGLFAGVQGLVTVQNWISVFPRQVSSIFLIRVDDPDGRFRAGARRAWPRR